MATLPNLQAEALEPLIAHLGRVQAQEPLALTMPELVQLYQGMQVCGMVFVSDVMSRLGLEDAFPTLPDDERAATEPAPASNRQAVGEMVSGFTHWVQQHLPRQPRNSPGPGAGAGPGRHAVARFVILSSAKDLVRS